MNDDEIDLSELFFTLWAYKLLIAVISAASLFAAGYHALTTKKEYTAKAIFQIEQSDTGGGFSLGGDLGGLAALAGLAGAVKSGADALIERAQAREFILEANAKLSLEDDPYFNRYDPNYVDPFWKSTLKQMIGWESLEREQRAIIESEILGNFIKFVSVESTDAGALSVSVVHEDPELAAQYANGLMEQMQTLVEVEKNQETQKRLNYLSDILADALIDLEKSQKRLSDFSVENSVDPLTGLITDSSKLTALRDNIELVEKFLLILPSLREAIEANKTDQNTYATLRARHPLIDDVRFRRIMGMSEAVSEWRWPALATVNLVEKTLTDRLGRLTVELNEVESQAEVTAESVEEFARLTREATVAEATYTVMIEQVKAQSLAAGYKPETFKVFEYATPPLTPSAPKRTLVLALGLVLGIFTGCAVALILGMRKSVYFTRSALSSAVNATHALRIGTMRRLSRLPLSVLSDRFSKRSHLQLDDLLLDMGDSKLILVTSSHSRITSGGIARLITASAAKSRRRVLLCDTSWSSNEAMSNTPTATDFDTVPAIDGANVLIASPDLQKSNLYTLQAFKAFVEKSMTSYDHVIVAGNDEYGKLAAKALKSLKPSVVFAARIGKTKKQDIAELTATTPVEVLLHD